MSHPKKNLFSQSIDLDVDHLESNLKQSTKILQEMKENLAKEVKDYLLWNIYNFFKPKEYKSYLRQESFKHKIDSLKNELDLNSKKSNWIF